MAQFIVDTLGRVEIESFRIHQSSNELFTAAVRSRLGELRFSPARKAGQRVRQLVYGAFEFPPGRAGGTWTLPLAPEPTDRRPFLVEPERLFPSPIQQGRSGETGKLPIPPIRPR